MKTQRWKLHSLLIILSGDVLPLILPYLTWSFFIKC